MTEAVDLLIHARWIIPIEPANTTLEHHTVAVRNGTIVSILPDRQAREQFSAPCETSLDHHVLMPGLVNLHCHAAMTLLRGLADDTPLMTWLQEHIWPAEAKHVPAANLPLATDTYIAAIFLFGPANRFR